MLSGLWELYAARELLRTLTTKELKVKYRNSVLGFLWSFAHPLLMIVVFTFAFKLALRVDIEQYPLFLLSGLLPWTFFSSSLTMSTGSIYLNSALVRKVYFPRAVLPLSLVLTNLVHFLATLVVFVAAVWLMGGRIGWSFLFLPLIVLTQVMMASGLGFIFATLNAFYRDVTYLLEVGLTALFYLTPVVYPFEMVPETFQQYLLVNPMAVMVDLYRTVLYGGRIPAATTLGLAMTYGVTLFWFGLAYLRRQEFRFAEEV